MTYTPEVHLNREEANERLSSAELSTGSLGASGLYDTTVSNKNYRGEVTMTFVPKGGDDDAVVVKAYENPFEAKTQYVAGSYIHKSLEGDARVYAPEMYDLLVSEGKSYVTMEYLRGVESLDSDYTHHWTSLMSPEEVAALRAEARDTVRRSLQRAMTPLALRLMVNDIGQRDNLGNILHDTTNRDSNRFAVIDQPNMLGRRDIPRAKAIIRQYGQSLLQ